MTLLHLTVAGWHVPLAVQVVWLLTVATIVLAVILYAVGATEAERDQLADERTYPPRPAVGRAEIPHQRAPRRLGPPHGWSETEHTIARYRHKPTHLHQPDEQTRTGPVERRLDLFHAGRVEADGTREMEAVK